MREMMFNLKMPNFVAVGKLIISTIMYLMGSLTLLGSNTAFAGDEAPDEFIKRLSVELQEIVKNDPALKAGDIDRKSTRLNSSH